MPEQGTTKRTKKGQSPSTQAGDYVREEIEHVREGKHGARSAKQAIAIGLSKARQAGVKLPPPPSGKQVTKSTDRAPNPTRSRATHQALEREGTSAASHEALSRQAHASAKRRGPAELHEAASKAVKTKGPQGRHNAAVKAAQTRARKAR